MLLFRKLRLWGCYKLRHVIKRDMFVFIKLQILNYKVSVTSMSHSIIWYNFLFENIFSCFRMSFPVLEIRTSFSCFGTSFFCFLCSFGKVILSRDICSCPCPGTKGQRDVPRDVPSLGNPNFYLNLRVQLNFPDPPGSNSPVLMVAPLCTWKVSTEEF